LVRKAYYGDVILLIKNVFDARIAWIFENTAWMWSRGKKKTGEAKLIKANARDHEDDTIPPTQVLYVLCCAVLHRALGGMLYADASLSAKYGSLFDRNNVALLS
jgi:hypothetical protein